MKTLSVGHSPDADDAFMFYGLASGRVKVDGYAVDHVLEDIESLNRRARGAELDVTAISAAAYPSVASLYRIMSCGASVGRRYGPIVLAREPLSLAQLAGRRVAVPGEHTTAYLLFRLYMTAAFEPVLMDFEAIMDAVSSGGADAGVVIHEGQLTWPESGLHKLADLGDLWMNDTGLPIPLGLDVIRRGLGDAVMNAVARGLKDSIVLARTHEEDAVDYAMQFGRGVDRETCRQFVRMYVNEDTVDMGDDGRRALETLYARAVGRGILDQAPNLDILWV
ncbi:MAG TPA: MqnA/MqnD/SBP family protein [Candidatus Krumholzibacteria bacterium]|nr:MqnA/MqnD/SBP family protein [Candidatus Krumholzibacteria bacterium]